MKNLKLKNPRKITIGHLNINSIRNKFTAIKEAIKNNLDIIIFSETKLGDSFPTGNFLIPGYKQPYRLDVSETKGGLLIFIRDDIPSRPLNQFKLPKDIQMLPIEINLRKQKWLLLPFYRPPPTIDIEKMKEHFLETLSNTINHYKTYSNLLLIGDINLEVTDKKLASFIETHDLYSLIKEPTCFKSLLNPSCIDLILTNRKYCFQNSKTFCTGYSDFHKMTYTMMKLSYVKMPPKKLEYRCYKLFNEEHFLADLSQALNLVQGSIYSIFENTFTQILDKHAPKKTKLIRANDKSFITKKLRKEFMTRTRLKNKAWKSKSVVDFENYKTQRNKCVKLLKLAKKEYYMNLDTKTIDNGKKFWSTFKPLLSHKFNPGGEKIILVENDTIIADEAEVAYLFNDNFINITKSLNLSNWNPDHKYLDSIDNIDNIKSQYANHPSILQIKSFLDNNNGNTPFKFSPVTPTEVTFQISKLRTNKGTRGDLPIKIIKLAAKVNINQLTDCINAAIFENIFPNELKLGDVSPIFKKDDSTDKGNFRPISVLSAVSKIYEKILTDQINSYMEDILSPNLCGFRKGYSPQYSLIQLFENWRNCLDNKGVVGAILMDLSKAYDCLPADLLIAKLDAYNFDKSALKLLYSYLTNRKQRVKVGSAFSTWKEIIRGVPQGSVLGPILFNIFINDLLLFAIESRICNFADDNTCYACENTIDEVIIKLEDDMDKILDWFCINSMVANAGKFQFIILGHKYKRRLCLDINGKKVPNSKTVELLGIIIDEKLSFNDHIDKITKKASNYTNSLNRICHHLNNQNAGILINTFFYSCFTYCPLIWMLCSKTANNKIIKVHNRASRLKNRQNSNMIDNQSIHSINIRYLLNEVFQSLNKNNPQFMWNIWEKKPIHHNLRNKNLVKIPRPKTETFGFRSLTFRGAILWNSLPSEIKDSTDITIFKKKIKQWNADNVCNCHLCRT